MIRFAFILCVLCSGLASASLPQYSAFDRLLLHPGAYASSATYPLTNGDNTFTIVAQATTGQYTTNVLTQNLPATVTFQYDANGNLTNDGLRSFTYDDGNQLTNITVTGHWRADFVYDGLGRRRITKDYARQGEAWVKTNETRYVYDGSLAIQERDSNNVPVVTYTRGLDLSSTREGAGGIGALLARSDSNGSAFYHADGSGNVTALLDSEQHIVARYLYDPFGNLLGRWGAMAEANLYRFSSKEVHPNSGLYYYGFRYYAPNLQRWLNQDPIGEAGGINLHRFVWNDPANWVDTDGLAPQLAGVTYDLSTGRTLGVNYALPGQGDPNRGLIFARPPPPSAFPFDYDWQGAALIERLREANLQWFLANPPPPQYDSGRLVSDDDLFAIFMPVPKLGRVHGIRCAAKSGGRTATQLELDFGQSLPWQRGESGLVIGRNADLSAPGALGSGEYRLNWFDVRDSMGEAANLTVNRVKIEGVLQRSLPIRDATPLSYTRSPYLNLERQSAQSLGWTYQNGRWIPPAR